MASGEFKGLIHGMSYSFPTSGTIRVGYTRTNGRGAKLPVKDDQFRITTKVKDDAGQWVPHALDAVLRESHGEEVPGARGAAERKLRRIPVRIVFDRPELNMTEQYAAFTNEGIPVCVGDGQNAKRRASDGSVTSEDCPGSRFCEYGKNARCDAFLRLLVRVEGQNESEPPMILRTGSVNAVTDNRATLEYWSRIFKGRLAGLPFNFVLDAKQTALSRQSVFYFGRLEPAFASATEGAKLLREMRAEDEELGIDRAAAEDALMALRNNGSFAEDTDDGSAQMEDLIVGRFSETGADGETREITIGAPQPQAGFASPTDAASEAIARLNNMLSTIPPDLGVPAKAA